MRGPALRSRQGLRFGSHVEEFEIRLQIAALRGKRLDYVCTMFHGSDIVAIGKMSTVCVRNEPPNPLRAIPIPDHIAERLAATVATS